MSLSEIMREAVKREQQFIQRREEFTQDAEKKSNDTLNRLLGIAQPVIECLERIGRLSGSPVEIIRQSVTGVDGLLIKMPINGPEFFAVIVDIQGRIAGGCIEYARGIQKYRDTGIMIEQKDLDRQRNLHEFGLYSQNSVIEDKGFECVMSQIADNVGKLLPQEEKKLAKIFDDIEKKYGPFKGPVTPAAKSAAPKPK